MLYASPFKYYTNVRISAYGWTHICINTQTQAIIPKHTEKHTVNVNTIYVKRITDDDGKNEHDINDNDADGIDKNDNDADDVDDEADSVCIYSILPNSNQLVKVFN